MDVAAARGLGQQDASRHGLPITLECGSVIPPDLVIGRSAFRKMSLWRNTRGRNDNGLFDRLVASRGTAGLFSLWSRARWLLVPVHVGGRSVADRSHSVLI